MLGEGNMGKWQLNGSLSTRGTDTARKLPVKSGVMGTQN